MKTNKPKLKNIDEKRTQHSNKSNAHNKCCIRHKDIEYVFIVWRRVFEKKFLKLKIQLSIDTYSIYKEAIFCRTKQK